MNTKDSQKIKLVNKIATYSILKNVAAFIKDASVAIMLAYILYLFENNFNWGTLIFPLLIAFVVYVAGASMEDLEEVNLNSVKSKCNFEIDWSHGKPKK